MTDEALSFRGETSASFGDVLASLKRRGCNLLVTGEVADNVAARATRKLFGTPAEPRERVLALADASVEEPVTYLPGNLYPHHDGVELVDFRDVGRAVANGECVDGGAGRSLAELGDDVCDAVERRGSDLDPAQLRVGLVSLRPLVERYDESAVDTLAERVTDSVGGVSGMAHYHVGTADDAAVVDELAPHFDARIELRQLDGMIPEQRWHVHEYDAETGWVTL